MAGWTQGALLVLIAVCLSGCACAECEDEELDREIEREIDREIEKAIEETLEELDDKPKPGGRRPRPTAKPGKPGESKPAAGGGSCVDVSGTWRVTANVNMKQCGEGNKTEQLTMRLTQKGCRVTANLGGGVTLGGTVRGNRIGLSGSYQDMGTIKKNLNLTASGNTLRGSGTWTYSTSGFSCKGTERISGSR